MFMFQIEEHRICVCVRARPLNKKGKRKLLKSVRLVRQNQIFVFFLCFLGGNWHQTNTDFVLDE